MSKEFPRLTRYWYAHSPEDRLVWVYNSKRCGALSRTQCNTTETRRTQRPDSVFSVSLW